MPALAANECCTGCTACASVCPKTCVSMEADENGFLYPAIDVGNCVGCGLCEKVCPVISPLESSGVNSMAYAAYSQNEELRMNSSSGGIFSELAEIVLKDSGTVFGAAYNERFEIVHICAESESDLVRLRGAKYAQSDLCGIFENIKSRLDQGQRVLFSGTPCQVGGLKAYLRQDYENLLTLDFVCHSVPSPIAWLEYVKYRAGQDNSGQFPTTINLRSKHTGWTKYQYSNLFTYANGNTHSDKSGESLYMKLFVGGYISRRSCANCLFKGYSRVSDLTLGDFWGIGDIAPEMDDNKGTSVVFVHTSRGAELIDRIKGDLLIKQVTLEEASRQNPAILTSSVPNEKREEALELIRNGQIEKCSKWFIPPKVPIARKLYSVMKRVIRHVQGLKNNKN